MRWIWLDKIIELQKAKHCVAIKNVSAAEDVLHDHFPANEQRNWPACPVFPHSLVIEAMAQCAGILVGHARDFKEKVLLAKINRAVFAHDNQKVMSVEPGMTLIYHASIERIDSTGASTIGTVELQDSYHGKKQDFAQIDLMFSHVDNAQTSELDLPKENFVFTDQFMDLLQRSGFSQSL